MKTVFIAHPLAGDIEDNIAHAKHISRLVSDTIPNVTPICPIILYTAFLDDNTPSHRQRGIDYCRQILPLCDELWLAKGWKHSTGCMNEYIMARELGMPVYQLEQYDHTLRLVPVSDHIICLVGESGSGKTRIARELSAQGYHAIQSYTTRKPRYPDEWGHIFVDPQHYSFIKADSHAIPTIQKQQQTITPIAYTFYNDHHYWATAEQYQNQGISIYPVDPTGLAYIYNTIQDAIITSIYLNTDSHIRFKRMQNSHRSQAEAKERLKHDQQTFKIIQCDYCIDNNGTLQEVIPIMMSILNIGGAEYCLPRGT